MSVGDVEKNAVAPDTATGTATGTATCTAAAAGIGTGSGVAIAAAPQRWLWLDAVKALSIVAVVLGHVMTGPETRYVFLWRMPLFFMLAGYVFKPDADLPRFARERALRLLLPYVVFVVPLSSQDFAALVQNGGSARDWLLFAASHVAGGKSVYGWLVAVWFVTCLYFTLLLVNAGITRLSSRAMDIAMCACLLLAYANATWLPKFFLPWAAHISLFAAPILYLGHRFRRIEPRLEGGFVALLAALAIPGFYLVWGQQIDVIDMKQLRYGTPFVTLGFALCIAVVILWTAKRWLGRVAPVGPLRWLGSIGEASLVILFLHQAIQTTLNEQFGIDNIALRVVAGVVLPTLLYHVLKRFRFARAVFLGSAKDFHALRSRRRAPLAPPRPAVSTPADRA